MTGKEKLQVLVDNWKRESVRHKRIHDAASKDRVIGGVFVARASASFLNSVYQRYVDYDRRARELESLIKDFP